MVALYLIERISTPTNWQPHNDSYDQLSNHSNMLAKEGAELSQLDWPCKIDLKKNMERTI